MLANEIRNHKEFLHGEDKLAISLLNEIPHGYPSTHLGRQCISHDHVVGVIGLFAQVSRDISWLGRPGTILQPAKVCLDFIQVGLELHLVRKRNVGFRVLLEPRVRGAVNHHSKIGIILQIGRRGHIESDFQLDAVSGLFSDWKPSAKVSSATNGESTKWTPSQNQMCTFAFHHRREGHDNGEKRAFFK